jgi:glycosyltransferase involved in cell wall biosynthesis/predicted flap endonuclease-1-like 5' DNA nuclease
MLVENLTALVPFRNGHEWLPRLLASLPADLPVIVVDDHSDTPLEPSDRYRLLRPKERGYFTGAVNVGMSACDTDVLILNQDAELRGDAWLNLILKKRKTYAMIGERIGGVHPAWPNGYIHGTFTYIRRDAIRAIGYMNAADYPLWGSTCEYQVRLCRRGFKVLPLVKVPGMIHDRPGKFGAAITEALKQEGKRDLFIRTPPMVSVIIPCFNYGKYLTDCIRSLIGGDTCLGPMPGQTFQSFEAIIVNDASTDNTARIGARLDNPWQGVRYIRLGANGGTAAAINAGVRASIGRYVTVLSADDMAEPWHLESLLRTCQANPHSVAFGEFNLFKRGQRFEVLKLPGYDFERTLYKNGMGTSIMYPRRAWEEVGGYPEIMKDGREDWAFNVGLGIKGWCGVKVEPPEGPGYLGRREGHNRSLCNAGPGWRNAFMAKMMALYPSVYQGERPEMCCGGGRKSAKPAPKGAGKGVNVKGFQMPGQDGLELLEYTGSNYGTTGWWGPVTGTKYDFGNNDAARVKYVDVRDVPKMLLLSEGTKNKRPIFRKYRLPPKQEAAAVVAEVRAPEYVEAPSAAYVEVKAEADMTTIPWVEVKPVVIAEPVEDLTAIRGVGPAIAAKLRGLGFCTVAQVAAYSADDLAGLTGLQLKRAVAIVEAARG